MNTIIAVIGAVSAAITATGGAVVSLFVLVPSLRIQKTTHAIVNQQRTDMQNYQRTLVSALKAAHVEVPVDQSAPPLAPTSEEGP